jgi:hypothetical protein
MRICWALSQTVGRTAAAEARASKSSAKRELIINRKKVLLPNAAAPLAASQCPHAGGRPWPR